MFVFTQYNIVIHTCHDTPSVQEVLRQMDEAGIAYDQSTFMTCYNVFERAAEYDKAIKVLLASQQEGIIEKRKVVTTTTNTLKRLLKRQGPRHAWQWVDCLKAHGAYTKQHAKVLTGVRRER